VSLCRYGSHEISSPSKPVQPSTSKMDLKPKPTLQVWRKDKTLATRLNPSSRLARQALQKHSPSMRHTEV
jgi:hypothetical protein